MTRALVPGRYLVGHTDLCDVRLQDPQVGARHAQLIISDIALIVDLPGSTGTFVNGEKIHGPRTLSNGDRVRFGSRELTLWLRPLPRSVPEQPTGEHAVGFPPFDGERTPTPVDVAETPRPGKLPAHESGTRRIVPGDE